MMVEHGQSLVCRKELTPFVCSRRVLRDAECTRCKRDAHESAHATGAAMSIVVSVRVRHATRNWSVLAVLTDGQKTALALEVTLPRMHLLPCCIQSEKRCVFTMLNVSCGGRFRALYRMQVYSSDATVSLL